MIFWSGSKNNLQKSKESRKSLFDCYLLINEPIQKHPKNRKEFSREFSGNFPEKTTMPRITADLVLRSPSYFNPLREREIDLRGIATLFFLLSFAGNKIPIIENLGTTQVLLIESF